MSTTVYDDAARTVTTLDASGLRRSQRPYTLAENAAADAGTDPSKLLGDLEARVARLEAFAPPNVEGHPMTLPNPLTEDSTHGSQVR